MPRNWILWYPVRPWTINKDRNWHHHQRAKNIKEWRNAFRELAVVEGIPRCNHVAFEIQPVLGDRRVQDTAACVTAAKAAIDGIVDAGVIEDDAPPFMQWMKFYPPVVEKGKNGLLVRVIECDINGQW